MSEIKQWFLGLPQFTRYWFGLSVVFPLAGRIGLLSPYHMILTTDLINKFQLWRPLTALFFYPMKFHYLINLYFLYSYSIRLENEQFNGRPADYLFLLIFNWFSIVIISLAMNVMLLMDPMVLSVLYIWCNLNKDIIVNFWFGTQFKALYLPWVLLGFNIIMGGGGVDEIIGIIVGHLYYFIMYRYPEEHGGQSLLQTPSILYNYFPSTPGRGSVYGGFQYQPPPQRSNDQNNQRGSGRHNWGSGNVLGNN
ncbi:derlin-1-like [Oppia nitens]|uniref:derlin-1-like n=1 Tax=Oppia nitens TaxID=1686743 RepID=UPI0023DBAFD1|nr:derlin-1-like [Oppia nitens]